MAIAALIGGRAYHVIDQWVLYKDAPIKIFLPPYSSDPNPIEQVFSKLKTLLRKARARTLNAVSDSIGDLLNDFAPTECANYLSNSGYAST